MAGPNDSGQAEAQAMKILGDKGDIPPPRVIDKAATDRVAAQKDFMKNTDQLNSSLLAFQNALSDMANSVGNYINTLEKDNFNLDKKADAKKIAQARKILVGFYEVMKKNIEQDVKALDTFDKQLDGFNKFKL